MALKEHFCQNDELNDILVLVSCRLGCSVYSLMYFGIRLLGFGFQYIKTLLDYFIKLSKLILFRLDKGEDMNKITKYIDWLFLL